MSVELILVTHGKIGDSLLEVTAETLGHLPIPASVVPVATNCDCETITASLEQKITAKLDAGQEVLLLTDLFGATPCNLANKFQEREHVMLVAGINLSMLLRIMNYPTLSLCELAEKAISGGHDGIINCCDK